VRADSAFVLVAPPPATVTQRTVEQHFGVTPRLFKEMVREGLVPSKRIGHTIFVAYEDVRRAVTEGAEARQRVARAIERVVGAPAAAPMAIDAAFEYLGSARTRAERIARKKEITSKAHELMLRYGSTLADGSANPEHDARLDEHGERLLLATAGLRFKTEAELSAPASATSTHRRHR
jgi:hypothetical protein